MSKPPLTSAADRRDFLKLAMAAGGVLAVTGVAKPGSAEPSQNTTAPSTPKQGYRETAHIRAYYARARI